MLFYTIYPEILPPPSDFSRSGSRRAKSKEDANWCSGKKLYHLLTRIADAIQTATIIWFSLIHFSKLYFYITSSSKPPQTPLQSWIGTPYLCSHGIISLPYKCLNLTCVVYNSYLYISTTRLGGERSRTVFCSPLYLPTPSTGSGTE